MPAAVEALQWRPMTTTRSGEPSSPSNDGAGLRAVQSYYNETWLDYRMIWMNRTNRSIHFGYWDEDTRTHSESLLNTNRVLAERAEFEPGELALDAGCGVGGTAMWLAEHHGVRVMGVTVVHDQAERAYRYSGERGLEGLEFSVQDYMRTAFRPETFDVAYSMEASNYASSKRDWLAEMYRVLKPGGRLVVQDGFRASRPLTDAEDRLQRSWLDGWAVPHLAALDEFAGWAEELGFTDVVAEDRTTNFAPSCRRLYRVTMACYPVAKALHTVKVRSDVQQGNVRAARDQWRAMRRRLWLYGIVTARKPG
jgi:cyclopropane fatty-acyl-phospholipid synthase-like methyltransferase